MKKDQLQDKYNEIFRDIKEEKMDWSFEDFLQTTEGAEPEQNTAPIIPLGEKKKPSFPKWFWMAASVMLIFGFGVFLNYNNSGAISSPLSRNTVHSTKHCPRRGDVVQVL